MNTSAAHPSRRGHGSGRGNANVDANGDHKRSPATLSRIESSISSCKRLETQDLANSPLFSVSHRVRGWIVRSYLLSIGMSLVNLGSLAVHAYATNTTHMHHKEDSPRFDSQIGRTDEIQLMMCDIRCISINRVSCQSSLEQRALAQAGRTCQGHSPH